MNGYERVKRAIEFEGPDRVPKNYYHPLKGDVIPVGVIPPSNWQPPEPYYPFGVLPELIKLRIWRPGRPLPKNWQRTRHQAMDEWGCIWDVEGEVTSKGQIAKGALEDSWDLLDSLRVPDMKIPERYKLFGAYMKLLGKGKYRLACYENFIFSRFHFLRGFSQGLTDLIIYPEYVERLLDMMEQHYTDFIEMCGKYGAHGIEFPDDLGTQTDLLISPKLFQKFFKPRYARMADKAHQLGMHFIVHSCGNIGKLIPDLIEAGVDALQLDAPDQTGLDVLAELAGGKIAFFNVVDTQKVLPAGSREEIEAYAKLMKEKLGSYNGGLIATTYPSLYSIGATKEQEKIMFNSYR